VKSGSCSSKYDVVNIVLREDDEQGERVNVPGWKISRQFCGRATRKRIMDDIDEVDESPAVSTPAGPT
jgi:hypothetical protein